LISWRDSTALFGGKEKEGGESEWKDVKRESGEGNEEKIFAAFRQHT